MGDSIDTFTGEYRFLSNFWPSPVVFEGTCYPTVEHFFQAMKTRDNAVRQQIASLASPVDAKRYGRRDVALRPDWDDVKMTAMRHGLELKFAPRSELAHRLLATGERLLVEGNKWGDTFWGVSRGIGGNHLGLLLMSRRAELSH